MCMNRVKNLNRMLNEVSIRLPTLQIELIAPTTVKTTEHYMENGKKSRDSQMVGDYGVEEWRDGGKLSIPTAKSINNMRSLIQVALNSDFHIIRFVWRFILNSCQIT